nr:hypothetical protein [Tanacetum cinerariifolium]
AQEARRGEACAMGRACPGVVRSSGQPQAKRADDPLRREPAHRRQARRDQGRVAQAPGADHRRRNRFR